jgi:hypothetical protein
LVAPPKGTPKIEGFQPEQRRIATAHYLLGLEALDLLSFAELFDERLSVPAKIAGVAVGVEIGAQLCLHIGYGTAHGIDIAIWIVPDCGQGVESV